MRQPRTTRFAGLLLLVISCGGSGTGPDNGDATISKATPSGDGQSGAPGSVLPLPLRVLVTEGGTAAAGRTVAWTMVTPGGGVSPATSLTGADGIATTTVTLSEFGAVNKAAAALAGASGSPQVFELLATPPTTQVSVLVINNEFLPAEFNLKAGGTVTFTWQTGAVNHNVTPGDESSAIPASSGLPGTRNAPYSFSAVFPVAGRFPFFCSAHGSATSGMRGAITVVP